MNEPLSKDRGQSQGISRSRRDILPPIGVVSLEDLIHDLRQPLAVIESLSFVLELTSTNITHTCPHILRIRAMVDQAYGILEGAALAQSEAGLDNGKRTESDK